MPDLVLPNTVYNRYTRSNGYKRHLFRPGRGFQSSEANEIHDFAHADVKALTDILYKEGAVLQGGSVQTNGTSVTIQRGVVYAKGYTHDITEGVLTIGVNETCSLGFALKQQFITENEDPMLRDQAQSTRNYNEPGAAILKMTVRWCREDAKASDEDFYPTAQFVIGVLQTKSTIQVTEGLDTATRLVQRYDYDTNGDFVIRGFQVQYLRDIVLEFKHVLSAGEGLAHVAGVEVNPKYSQLFSVDWARDVRYVGNEPVSYSGAGDYTLRHPPIAHLFEVNGQKEVTRTITRGGFSGGSDIVPNIPLVQIISVEQGATTFTAGVDYQQTGDNIDWSLGGTEPSPGSSYDCTFRYQALLTPTISSDLTKINLSGLVNGTLVYVDYDHYLNRYDRVVLLSTGEIILVKGASDDLAPYPPQVKNGLIIATVFLRYGYPPEIEMGVDRVFLMKDLAEMGDALWRINYNLMQLSLKDDVRALDPATNKKNIFVDPFNNGDLRDLGITQNALIGSNHLMANVDWTVNPLREGQNILLTYVEANSVNQDSYTGERPINEFTWAGPPPAQVRVRPDSYRWVSGERTVWSGMTWEWWAASNWHQKIVSLQTPVTQVMVRDSFNVTVPQIGLTFTGGKFNGNESVSVSVDGLSLGSLTADVNGYINGALTLPAGVKSGSKMIRVRGTVSGAEDAVPFTAIPFVREIRRSIRYVFNDPIAQTFTLDADESITSVEFIMTSATAKFVDVIISETLVGMPDRRSVIGVKRLYPADIALNVWQKAVFDSPVHLLADREYSVILESPDSIGKVRVAELGKWNIPKNSWLSTQSYSTGVLLNSANGSTWSPIQNSDLTFRLNRANYIGSGSGSEVVTIGTVNVTNCSDLMLLTAVEVGRGTSCVLSAVLDSLAAKPTYALTPNVGCKLDALYTGAVIIKAALSTTINRVSPEIEGNCQIAVGQVQFPAVYATRSFPCDGVDAKVLLDIFEPTNTSIKVYIYNTSAGTWHEGTRQTSQSRPVGDSFIEMPFVFTGFITDNAARIKIVMDSVDVKFRPTACKLRCFVS